MTNREFLRRYWSETDKQEEALLKRLARLHPEDALQDALDRFGSHGSTAKLDAGELNRLHRDIAGWKGDGILSGEFGLRARDAANRKRITADEALLVYLMAAWTAYYYEVERYTIEMCVAAIDVPQAEIKERLSEPIAQTAASLHDALAVDAAYRARQIQKRAAIDRAQERKSSMQFQEYTRIMKRARRWLLALSEPTDTMPNGHHGYLDRVMADLLSYFAIEAYKRDGVREVQFVAVMDEVTTHNCRRLNGRIFAIDDLRPGINAPPIADPPHHCRSVLKPLKTLQLETKSGIISLRNEVVGRSLGAKRKDIPVRLPNGEFAALSSGTGITNKTVIAGAGRERQIDIEDVLVDQYGGYPGDWAKLKGFGYIDDEYGEPQKTELHWYENGDGEKYDVKIKPQKDGEWYIYES